MSPKHASNHRPKQSPRSQPSQKSPSELARVNLYHHRWSWTAANLARFAAFTILILAVVFGAMQYVWSLKAKMIAGHEVDADLQLALLGFVNKIMDLLVTKSLQNFAGVCLTLAMTSTWYGPWNGAYIADLEFAEELTKPWHSVTGFCNRWRIFGWRKAGWVRFVATLIVSVCVILQGLALNTLGYPKERWHPESGGTGEGHISSPMRHPVPHFIGQGLDWHDYWDSGWKIAGNGEPSWGPTADALLASQTFLVLKTFADTVVSEPYGWQHLGDLNHLAALDTRHSESGSQGLAMQQQVVVDIFHWLQRHGSTKAKASIGWTGNISLELPSVQVSCDTFRGSTKSEADSVTVQPILANPSNVSLFEISISPVAAVGPDGNASSSAGSTCVVSFSRVLASFAFWIVDNASTADISVNQFWRDYGQNPVTLPVTNIDMAMAQASSVRTAVTFSRLETIIANTSSAELFVMAARGLRESRSEYRSDAEAIAPVIAALTTQLLALAAWNITYTAEHQVVSSPIRWQLFGSGPRLKWEYVTVAILCILLVAMIFSFSMSLRYRIFPGEWLKPGGMLIAANSSPGMSLVGGKAADDEKELAKKQVFVREHTLGGTVLFSDSEAGRLLDLKQEYRWC